MTTTTMKTNDDENTIKRRDFTILEQQEKSLKIRGLIREEAGANRFDNGGFSKVEGQLW